MMKQAKKFRKPRIIWLVIDSLGILDTETSEHAAKQVLARDWDNGSRDERVVGPYVLVSMPRKK